MKTESGGIKAKMKKGGVFMINRKCTKKSNGYIPIEAVLCNDDKLHVPLGTPNESSLGRATALFLFLNFPPKPLDIKF